MLSYHHRQAPPPPPAAALPSNHGFKSSSTSHAATRAMATTHLQHGSRPKPPPNRPFDPEDLSRRLMVVLAEQQTHEKKKRARVFASVSGGKSQSREATEASREAEIRERWGLLKSSASGAAGSGSRERSSSSAMKTKSVENFRSGASGATAEAQQEARKVSRRSSKDGHNVLTKKYSNPELARRSSSQQSMHDATTNKHISSQAVPATKGSSSAGALIDRVDARQASWRGLKMRLQEVDEEKPIETIAATNLPAVDSQSQRYQSVRKSQSYRDQLYKRGNTPTPHVIQQKADSRDPKRQNRNTFDDAAPRGQHGRKPTRRSSMGELYRPHETPVEEEAEDPSPYARGRAQTAGGYYSESPNHHHPVDWTQGDEKSKKTRMPLLKKADSLLGLKTKFGGFSSSKHGRDADRPLMAEHWREHEDSNFPSDNSPLSPKSPKSPKSPRSRLFWPFKR